MTSTNLSKNAHVYWVATSAIAIWFLFIHSPPILIERRVFHDPPFLFHLIGAYTIYLACMFNTLFTPSMLDGKARPLHVFVGRVGMVAGVLGFIGGLYCSWWPSRNMDKGFAIGVTIGGSFQVFFQLKGYRAIKNYKRLKVQIEEMMITETNGPDLADLTLQKDKALEIHIFSMIGVFLPACSIPATIRIVDMIPNPNLGVISLVGIITLLNLGVEPFAKKYIKPTAPVNNEETTLAGPESSLLTNR